MSESHFFRNDIRRAKADPPDIVCQAIGIFLHHRNAVRPIGLEDLCRVAGTHIVPLQKEHDVFDLLLLDPALFDLLHARFPDARDTVEPVRITFDHFERVFTEGLHDPAGILGADSPDQSAPQVFFNPVDCRGQCLFKAFHGKLAPVPGVDLPAACQQQDTSHMYFRHQADHRHQIAESFCPAANHGIAVHFVVIGNTLYYAAQFFHLPPKPPAAVSVLLSDLISGAFAPAGTKRRRTRCRK